MTDIPQSSGTPVDHAWVHERMAASLVGGLSGEERTIFDSHINGCAECFDAFTEARDADRGMQRALSALGPGASFDENLLGTVREKSMHTRWRPVVRRAGMAIAAAVALAATGVFAQYVVKVDHVTGPLAERLAADSATKGITLPGFWKDDARSMGMMVSAQPSRPVLERNVAANVRSTGEAKNIYARVSTEDGFLNVHEEAREIAANLKVQAGGVPADIPMKAAEGQTGKFAVGAGVSNESGLVTSYRLKPKQTINAQESAYYKPAEGEPINNTVRPKLDLSDRAKEGVGSEYSVLNAKGAVDPNHNAAQKRLESSELPIQKQRLPGEEWRETQRVAIDNEEHLLPYTDLLVSPENWVELTRNRVADAGTGDSSHRNNAARRVRSLPRRRRGTAVPPRAGDVALCKIIRNGQVEFEVRSFDDASATISAVVTEEGGFVSSTSSEKLANGKIRGTVVVRVPPERLDRTLLKLGALGDLKTQQIAANDVTKQYTDIDSELRALRAMESRLIDLIKNGKGEVKDLVVAEKQLGEYRVRIEKLEGDLRYYNNLVGMATLSIVAYEKDIQTPTAASEMEEVSLAVETEDVEGKYTDARKILADAKGRIVESELKKYDAEQYSARIVVDVPPDKADFVTAQLKQMGRVGNYTRDRKQTTTGGSGVPTVKVEEKDTRFTITMYNLANIAPRETTVLTVAVTDVDAAYHGMIGLVRRPLEVKPGGKDEAIKPTGRVVTSGLSGTTADLRVDVQAGAAAEVLKAIANSGEVISSTTTENADTNNSTSAKRGIQLRLVSVASVPARETQTLRAVAGDVAAAYRKLTGALEVPAVKAHVITSQLTETDPRTMSAKLSFEARRDALPAVEKAFADAGIDFLSRDIVRSNDTANTLDSKIYFQIDELIAADSLAPRRTTVLGVEVDNVEKALDSLRGSLSPAKVKEVEYNLTKEASGRVTGHLVIETPVGNAMAVLMHIKDLGGTEKVNQVMKNNQVPDAAFARERIDLTLSSREAPVENGKGVGATIRAALGSSATALLLSLYYVLTGVLFLGPFLIVIWLGYRVARRRRGVT